jgi:hypothetical protein
MVEPLGPRMTLIWRMRTACWITKATNTYSQYVILVAVPLQQWSHERASVLRYTCIAFLWGGGVFLMFNTVHPNSDLKVVIFYCLTLYII